MTMEPSDPPPAEVKKEVQAHFGSLAEQYRQRNYEEALKRGKYPDIYMRHQHMLGMLNGKSHGRALEVGIGSGRMLSDLHGRGYEVYGVDLSPDMARTAGRLFQEAHGRAARVAAADLENLCFADATFDLVVLAGVIEYLPDPERALSEIARVLAPGGVLIISVRNKFNLGRPLIAFRDLFASLPGVGSLVTKSMNGLRSLFGREPDRDIVFARRDLPWRFRSAMRRHGLETQQQAFYHFTVIPGFVERRFPRPCIALGVKLERLSHTAMGYLGRGCIFKARKAVPARTS